MNLKPTLILIAKWFGRWKIDLTIDERLTIIQSNNL